MRYVCRIKVIDKEAFEQLGLLGKVTKEFPMTLSQSYNVGERFLRVKKGVNEVYEVVERVSLTVKQVE